MEETIKILILLFLGLTPGLNQLASTVVPSTQGKHG